MLINFIRHQVSLGLVEVKKIATQENVADVLTSIGESSDRKPRDSSGSLKRSLPRTLAVVASVKEV